MTIAIASMLMLMSGGIALNSFAADPTDPTDPTDSTDPTVGSAKPNKTLNQTLKKVTKTVVSTNAETVTLIEKNFKAAFPQVSVEKVTPFRAGLWEIFGSAGIVYTDATGSLLIQGPVSELSSKRNLTEERLNVLQKFDWTTIDKSKAIKFVQGNGKREMAVFADPSCGFCKKFETDLPKLENVTIYTFLVDILGPKSTERARNIWCAGDNEKRSNVWKKQMVDSVEAETKECVDVTKDNMDVGRKAGVHGTPTTFFPDGSRLVGALPIEQFADALNKQK